MKIKRVDEMNESWKTMVVKKAKYYARTSRPATCSEDGAADCFIAGAEWEDERMWETLNLLLDSIDHAYLQTNGSYGDLALEVADKVEYLKKLRLSKNRL